MKDIWTTIVKYAGYGFGALVIAFTAWQSYSLVFAVTSNQLESLIALVLFDIGTLYWFLVALKEAEGKLQLALAFAMFFLSLGLVILTVALQLGAVDANMLGQHTAAKLITLAAVINLVAKYIFPLVSLDNLRRLNERARAARLEDLVDKKVDSKMEAISDELAEEKAEAMLHNERHAIRMTIIRPEDRKELTVGNDAPRQPAPIAAAVQPAAVHPNGKEATHGHP